MKKHAPVTRRTTPPPSPLTEAAPPVDDGVKAILEIQRTIMLHGSSKSAVDSKISEVVAEIGKLNASIPPPIDVARAREDLLAGVATGDATAEELEEFDASALSTQKTYDFDVRAIRSRIGPLEATVAGLRRKAAHHAAEIDRLRAEHRHLCLDLLMERCEKAGKEYVEAVRDAVDAMCLVVVLASLHKRAGGENFIGEGTEHFNAMPLGTTSSRGTLPPLDPASRAAAFDAVEVEILDALRGEGLAIPFPETPAPPMKVRVPGIGEGIPVSVMRPPEPLRAADGACLLDHAVTEFDPLGGSTEE